MDRDSYELLYVAVEVWAAAVAVLVVRRLDLVRVVAEARIDQAE